MIMRKLVAVVLGIVVFTWCVESLEAAKPIKWTDEYSVVTLAGTVWTDWFGYEQACDFDFKVDYNDSYILHIFDDREIWNIHIRDIYTNLDTGFSFEDVAFYSIVWDYETGLAPHHGVFWRIRVPGTGMIVLDVGGFVQDWNDWTIVPGSFVGKNHDVNIPSSLGELPAVSYCDLMAENFPE